MPILTVTGATGASLARASLGFDDSGALGDGGTWGSPGKPCGSAQEGGSNQRFQMIQTGSNRIPLYDIYIYIYILIYDN